MQIVEEWPLDRLKEFAGNPRKNDHAVDAVAKAITAFGFRVPILAKSDGLIVDGHLRLKAAKKLGMDTVPVLLADDMTDTQIKAFRLSVNKMAELAGWDNDLLRVELADLQEMGFDIELTGFSLDEIAALDVDEEVDDPGGMTLKGSSYQVIVEADDEAMQARLLDEFEKRGLSCRALML